VAYAIDHAQECDEGIASAGIQLVLDISQGRRLAHGTWKATGPADESRARHDPHAGSAWRTFEDYRGALKSKYRKASVEMDKQLAARAA
jgi:hypothetical protein